jgi:hypothetical protein
VPECRPGRKSSPAATAAGSRRARIPKFRKTGSARSVPRSAFDPAAEGPVHSRSARSSKFLWERTKMGDRGMFSPGSARSRAGGGLSTRRSSRSAARRRSPKASRRGSRDRWCEFGPDPYSGGPPSTARPHWRARLGLGGLVALELYFSMSLYVAFADFSTGNAPTERAALKTQKSAIRRQIFRVPVC